MITTKQQLKQCIKTERGFYLPKGRVTEYIITADNNLQLYKYVRLLRYTEYHYNKGGLLHKVFYGIYRRRKNILGRKLGIEMWENTFDTGLMIAHPGNIVINGHSRIGKNCTLHGDNCIGNDGASSPAPKIGNNVKVGVGAKIIGDVTLADNITVGAGAVVVNSCHTQGAVLVGVPAKCVKINQNEAE